MIFLNNFLGGDEMKIAGFGVEAWLNQYEKSAVYDLSQSTIESLSLAEISKLTGLTLSELFGKQKLDYGWIEGSPAFKQAVAQLYQQVEPENVLQTNGATGANYLALYALLEPGDQIVAEYPSYQQLSDIPKSFGIETVYWRLDPQNNWYPDLNRLKQLITAKTKMICLNNANNPTGTLLQRDFLNEVVELAKQVNAYVLVDEVYQPLSADASFVSIVDLYEKGISTNSLSKTYSVPGIRVGWIATNDQKITDIFRKYRDYTMICAGVLNDTLAVALLNNQAKVLARNQQIVKENAEILTNWVQREDKVELKHFPAIPFAFPKFEINGDIETFCVKLLQETGVLLVPGNRFAILNHVRLGYCTDKATLKKGLQLLSEYLLNY